MKTNSIEAPNPSGLRRILFTGLALVAMAGLFGGLAFAVHDLDIFELEGNAVVDTLGDDWIQIYCDSIDPDRTGVCSVGSGDPKLADTPASNALVSVFAFDPFNPNADDVFTQGGSKDSRDISAWQWLIGGATNKADLEHAYAALYRDPVSMDFILYFGTDRLANNGDAALGFWFTQDEVTMDGDGDGASPIGGTHIDGDILIQTDWPQAAGATPRIEAYTWDSACIGNNQDPDCVAPAQGGLKRISSIAGTTCDTAGAGDDLCAVANAGDPNDSQVSVELAPWPYTFKAQGGNEARDAFPSETFFEGGINLTSIFPDGIPCISTFVAETRVSNSETAQLDDKLIAGFDLCSVMVTKEGPVLGKVGDPATYTITVTNDGALPLTQVSIIDDVLGVLTGQGNCGATLEPGASCTISASREIMSGDPDPLKNTVTVVYDRGGDQVTGIASHDVNLFAPSVTLDKKAEGSDGPVTIDQGGVVDYTITATNTSSDDTPNLSCTITDTNLGVSQNSTLTPGQGDTASKSVAFNFPTANPYPWCTLQGDGTFKCTNTASVSCSPEGFTNVVDASDTVDVIVVPAQVLLTVLKEGDAFGKVSDPVDYTITITNNSETEAVTLTSIVDTLLGDLTDGTNALITSSDCPVAPATLASLASCTIEATRTVQAGDADPLPNEVTVMGQDQFGNAGQAVDDHSVDLVAPSYTLSKSCVAEPVTVGDIANFQIDIVNDGDVNLLINVSDALLGINDMGVTLGERNGVACGAADFDPTGSGIGADAADGCLRYEEGVLTTEPGELNNEVNVAAILPPPYCADPLGDCELPNQIDDTAGDACTVEQGDDATRTWGFWKTHGGDPETSPIFPEGVEQGFTCYVFETGLGGVMDLGWKTVTSCEQLFDIFWANKGRQSDGSKRPQSCQLKLQASRQLAAAQLNEVLDNGADAGATIDALIAELGGNMKRKVIIDLMNDLAAFNESGDDVMIEADVEIPHADPRGTRTTAEEGFSDCN